MSCPVPMGRTGRNTAISQARYPRRLVCFMGVANTRVALPARALHSRSAAFHIVDGNACHCLNVNGWALNSAVECHPHTVEVVGSNPTAPTITSLRCDGATPLTRISCGLRLGPVRGRDSSRSPHRERGRLAAGSVARRLFFDHILDLNLCPERGAHESCAGRDKRLMRALPTPAISKQTNQFRVSRYHDSLILLRLSGAGQWLP